MTEMVLSLTPVPCTAAKALRSPAQYGLPADAVIRCCRAEHGPDDHEGYLAHTGGTVRARWHSLTG